MNKLRFNPNEPNSVHIQMKSHNSQIHIEKQHDGVKIWFDYGFVADGQWLLFEEWGKINKVVGIDYGWISVKERLPEDNKEVLVKHISELNPEYSKIHNRDVGYVNQGKWYIPIFDDSLLYFGVTVTHWMPLPPEPEDE